MNFSHKNFRISDCLESSTRYAPELLIDELPAATHVKSTYNITVERQWRPLYQQCLANIVAFWEQNNGEYHEGDPLHT
jgi:hypothetical protein